MHVYLMFVMIYFQNNPNGSGDGAAVYQQGAAVTYAQEGQAYPGPDTDSRIAALPGAGVALNGAYSGGGNPGWCD